MNQNDSPVTPDQSHPKVLAGILHKPWLKYLLGFLGWFLLTMPVVKFTDFFFGAYIPTTFIVLAILLVWKRTRLVGAGMASAIALNFFLSSILGTVMSPRNLAPIYLTYQYRWNFNSHYVSKNIPPETIADCVNPPAEGSASDPAQGQIAYEMMLTTAIPSEIYLMNAVGSKQENLTNYPETDMHPAWSPDGKKIAFSSLRDDDLEIYVMNADGSAQENLTRHPAADMLPTWSPDGTQVAFMSLRDSDSEIYVMNADGSNQVNLTHNPAADSAPAWSPDGRRIAFTSTQENSGAAYPDNTAIYVMNPDGTDVKRISPFGANLRPAWSPNGKCILYKSGDTFQDWIMLVKLDGSEPVKLIHAASYPDWSKDGRWIVYSVIHGEWNFEIYTLDLNTLQTSRLTNNSGNDTSPVWRP